MAKENGHGGARKGAGRKPKSDEIKKIETMDSILDPTKPWEELSKLVKGGDLAAIKFWIEHRFGKAKEIKEIEHTGDITPPWEKIQWGNDEE